MWNNSIALSQTFCNAPELERSITPATAKVNHIYFQQFQHSNILYFFYSTTKNLNNWTVCSIVELSPLSKGKKSLVYFSFLSQKRERGCVFALFFCLLSGRWDFELLIYFIQHRRGVNEQGGSTNRPNTITAWINLLFAVLPCSLTWFPWKRLTTGIRLTHSNEWKIKPIFYYLNE